MAKINPVKVKQDADKLEKANRLDQAIALYRQVVDDNPRDWNTINKIGDLYAKLNKNHEACEEYAKVADFYAKDGFLLKAIALWKKINRLEPASLGPYVNLAELYAKQGLMMEAKGQYQIVVEEYIKRGKMRDAGDVLKKMAEIDPADLKVRSKLADLYKREGNTVKAIEEHVAIAEELTRKGHLAEAVQVLENGLKIDAKNSRLRLELARVHFTQKSFDKAAKVLEEATRQAPGDAEMLARLGEAYLGAKRIEEAEGVYRRLLEINPRDSEARAQVARVALQQGQFDRAFEHLAPLVDQLIERREGERGAQLLQEIVHASPGHLKSLVKLAEVYRLLQKDSQVAAVYTQLTEAYIQQGFWDQAASVLEMLVSMDPQNQQHRSKLEFVRGRRGGPAAPGAAAAGGGVEIEEEFELGEEMEEFPGLGDEGPSSPLAPPPQRVSSSAAPIPALAGARPAIELSPPFSDDDREFIDEHLAEGKVFRKYGLVDKAVEQFEAIVARFPDHAEARLELRDVFREKGQLDRVALHLRALAQICRLKGDEAGARAHERELAEAGAPAPAPSAASAAALPPMPVLAQPEEAEEELQVEVGESEEEELAFPVEVAEEVAEEEEVLTHFPEAEEAEAAPIFFPPGGPEEEEIQIPPSPPAEEPLLEEDLGDVFGGAQVEAEEELPAHFVEEEEPLARPLVAEPAPAPVAAAEDLPADLRRGLAEVEEYSALGFVEDARQVLRDLQERHADHPLVQARAQELGLDRAPAPALGSVEEEFPGLGLEAGSEIEFPGLGAEPAPEPDFPGLEMDALAEAAPPSSPLGALARDEFPGLDLPVAEAVADEEEVELPGLDLPELAGPEAAATVELPGLELQEEAAAEQQRTEAFAGLDLPGLGDELPAAPPVDEFPGLGEPGPATVAVPEEPLGGLDLPLAAEEPAEALAFGAEPEPAGAGDLDSMLAEPAPAGEPGLDLGAELFSAFAAVEEPPAQAVSDSLGEAGLADIFREFKKGVDKQLGQEDYDTRYNLGIAYKEMGLVDEAIAEFQLAAKDAGRLLECSSMLGICFLEKGMPKLAVKWFEKGLEAPGRSEEEYLGLRYDLASAYEADGDLNRAVGILIDLHGQDPQFRDVGERLRALRAAGARS